MAAFEAPEGQLSGRGTLAVQLLTWTTRPEALLSAGRKALITEIAPKTLTSNSRRMASSASTSIGPGVRIPALLISRSTPAAPTLADISPAQAFTASGLVMSQTVRVTRPPQASFRSLISGGTKAGPKTTYPLPA